MRISPPTSCFSLETSLTTSLSTVELVHLGFFNVEDTTYLGKPFIRAAHGSVRPGVRVPNHSSLLRPSNMASACNVSSVSCLAHPSKSFPTNCLNQPPCLKPSSPSGS